MKKLLVILLMLTLCTSAVALELAPEPIVGEVCYPDDDHCRYRYRYSYPRFAGDDEITAMVNGFYDYQAEDALAFAAPMMAESIQTEEGSFTAVTGRVTYQSEQYLSVLIETKSCIDGGESTVYSAQTFALAGPKAGSVASLPWVLGLLTRAENDTWLEDRQTAKANNLVRELVWSRIEDNDDDIPFFADVSFDLLSDIFYPEEDFYMNENGDLVFFLQPGSVAEEIIGAVTFTFSADEILDEL